MNTKNQRIAEKLQWMAASFRNIAVSMEDTIKILLEKDTVVAATVPISKEAQLITKAAETAATCLSDNAGRGTWGAALAASNRGDYKEVARIAAESAKSFKENIKAPVRDWKDAMTEEINANNSKVVAEICKKTAVGDTACYDYICGQITNLTLIRRSPGRARYYKIRNGVSKGCVIQVNDKTSKVIKDGRYNGISLKAYSYVATVTCDQDGKDYVNRVIRPLLTKNQKIVRMYRPKGHAGHFTHCDIYVSKRDYTKP